MIRRLTCSLLSLVLMALWTAGARAADGLPPLETEESGPRVPVLGFFLAFGFTVLTLVILCMPSRKT
jgi:hypothetical protein